MQPASLPSLLCLALALGRVTGAPAATPGEGCTPRTLCIDGLTCGVRWGGCYDVCKPERRPTAPRCESSTVQASSTTASVTATATTIVTRTLIPPTTRPFTTTASTRTLIPPTTRPFPTDAPKCPDDRPGSGYTVCWDGVNECGMMYGGCFADCKPWPTFAKPPCRSTTIATAAHPTL